MEERSAPGSTCSPRSDAAAASPALQQPACPFEFEDVDCKANRHLSSKASATASGSMSADAVGDLLGDSVQSPLPAIKETGEILAVSLGSGTSLAWRVTPCRPPGVPQPHPRTGPPVMFALPAAPLPCSLRISLCRNWC